MGAIQLLCVCLGVAMQLLGYTGLFLECSEWLLGCCYVVARVLWAEIHDTSLFLVGQI